MHRPKLDDLIRRDSRYPLEAYEFVFSALAHTQYLLGRKPPSELLVAAGATPDDENHVTGQQLLWGIRDLALREFGLMARTVFRLWGINRTADFGEIVFNLIESGLMSKTSQDERRDFQDVYDLDLALGDYRIEVPQQAEER
jgi:uncharacterized repeat protein (TIGR04138 family)